MTITDLKGLAEVLRGGRQCDEDGTEIIMSRQACCEAAEGLEQQAVEITLLRSALVGLVGAETVCELRQMEAAMRVLPAPDADKAVSINAIHALLETMPNK